MDLTLSKLYNESYNNAVTLNLQQKGSKLSNCVRYEIQKAERAFYDQIGPTEAVDIDKPHSDTPLIDTKFDRRMVVLKSSDWADLIDQEDKLRLVEDPTSAYALNAAYALGRVKDRRIIQAALGEAYAGLNGENKITLPPTQTIKADYGTDSTHPSKGLTVEKLRLARQMLDEAEVDDDEEQYCVLTAKQVADLLRSVEVTSDDYNTVKALVDGKVNTFLGFTFKRVSSTLLPSTDAQLSGGKNASDDPVNSGQIRSVLCFAKSGLLMASPEDIKTDISYRKDKRMAVQVYASLACGATRMNEKKVVRIEALELK